MHLNEYQIRAKETAIYPTLGHPVVYPALGLAGEAGEVSEKVKKLMRDFDGNLTPSLALNIALEVSDVLWYIAAVANEIGYSLEEIASLNLAKLKSRQERGTLNGNGDHR